MARVLNTLKQGDATRNPRKESAVAPPEECVVDWTLAENEVPYIEVGGPGKQVELSPSLVPHPPQPKVQPPHVVVKPAAVDLSEARPMLVAYEPWPAGAGGSVAPEVITYHQPEHPVSQEYAVLCGRMLSSLASQVVLLSGIQPRVGTTTVLLNLAVTAVRTDARQVVLVDASWSSPALAARLGLPVLGGAQDVLAGTLALEQAIVATPLSGLSLLPPGKSGGPLSGEALSWLLAWLRERFDVVLIDGPPLTESAALAILAPACDALYAVLPQGDAPGNRAIAQAVPRLGGRLRGLIHTRFEA